MALRNWWSELFKEYPPLDPATKARFDAEFAVHDDPVTLNDIANGITGLKRRLTLIVIGIWVIAFFVYASYEWLTYTPR